MIQNATQASTTAPAGSASYSPAAYSYTPPAAAGTGSSSNVAGAIGATGTSSGPAATPNASNGTVASPVPSSPITPFTGTAVGQEVDQKMLVCFAIGLVTAVLLI
ncbi:hypothetical protein LTR65_006438 [Meristemomyces frigidus]